MLKVLVIIVFILSFSCSPVEEFKYNNKKSLKSSDSAVIIKKPSLESEPQISSKGSEVSPNGPKVDQISSEPEKYPLLEYTGISFLDLVTYGQYHLYQKVIMETSKDDIRYTIQKQNLIHYKGSNYTDDVNNKLPSAITRIVIKSKVEDLKKLESKGFKNFDFIVYASQINEGLKSCSFSSPVPVFVVPKSYVNAYDEIKKPVYYESVVSGCIKQDQVLINLSIRCEIRNVSNNDKNTDGVSIAINCSINSPADQKGEFYEQLPLPHQTFFNVNIKTKQVESYYQSSYLLSSKYDEWKNRVKYGELGNVTSTFKLCKSTVDGKTKTFDCKQ